MINSVTLLTESCGIFPRYASTSPFNSLPLEPDGVISFKAFSLDILFSASSNDTDGNSVCSRLAWLPSTVLIDVTVAFFKCCCVASVLSADGFLISIDFAFAVCWPLGVTL